MKLPLSKIFIFFLFSTLIFSFTSCSVAGLIIYPWNKEKFPKYSVIHQDYMDQFKTQQDVYVSYGKPAVVDTFQSIITWKYILGNVSDTRVGAFVGGGSQTTYGNNSRSSIFSAAGRGFGTTNEYQKTVQFSFEDAIVINWRTYGVDYTQDNPKYVNRRTAALYLIALGLPFDVLAGFGAYWSYETCCL